MSESKFDVANEPVSSYLVANLPSIAFIGFFGSNLLVRKGESLTSDFDIIELSRRGLPKNAILHLAKKIALTLQELSGILHLSERTLQRYDDHALVRPEYSDKAIELARLYARGEDVFGSLDKFKTWMKFPSQVFSGKTPLSLLDTSAGFHLVIRELGRIEYGVFS